MSTSLLGQVRNVARKAAKVGTGWHIKKSGEIACKDGRCTLGALLFNNYAPVREIQEEFNALIKRAATLEKGQMVLSIDGNWELFDFVPSDEKFPDPSEVAEALDMDDELTQLVTEANDNTLASLKRDLANARTQAEEEKLNGIISSIYDYESWEGVGIRDLERKVKARIILEEELLGKGK